MRVRFLSLGRILAVAVLISLSLSYARADNFLSGEFYGGISFGLGGGEGGGGFPGWHVTFADTYTGYYEYIDYCHYGGCKINFSAVIDGGSIQFSLDNQGQSYVFDGDILSGQLGGYYCTAYMVCPPGMNTYSISFQFDGTWSNGWPAQGDLWAMENDFYHNGLVRIVTEVPESTIPEPSTLVMLGSGVLGLAGVIRRRLSA
jgi:hypothetical protein